MYYPYLHGRQNELLCLRNLLEKEKLGVMVVPVIEPVRCNNTFFSTIEKFVEKEHRVIVIDNPHVGKFAQELSELKQEAELDTNGKKEKIVRILEQYERLMKSEYIVKGHIIDHNIVEKVLGGKLDVSQTGIINLDNNYLDQYMEYGEKLSSYLTFIPSDGEFKTYILGEKVLIEDSFKKARKNADYLNREDEVFSSNHLSYLADGYQGFSDYSIAGKDYEESGFAPLAIAIHVVYFGKNNILRVHHFVSDSNNDIFDPARKFQEAMGKLCSWENLRNVKKTMGLSSLLQCYEERRFPGLGVIKRYTLMHHLELVSDFLGDE